MRFVSRPDVIKGDILSDARVLLTGGCDARPLQLS